MNKTMSFWCESIFFNHVKKTCLLIEPIGNVGDDLIQEATKQILNRLNVKYISLPCSEVKIGHLEYCDVAFWGGGGNMGSRYEKNFRLRNEISEYFRLSNKEFEILPQTWTSEDTCFFTKAYARDIRSLSIEKSAIIAPDPAMVYEYENDFNPVFEKGVFFRENSEVTEIPDDNIGDPINMARTPSEYIDLAGKYREVHTNRIHFAISALIAGCKVVLYPGQYFKVESMYKTWFANNEKITFKEYY